MLRKHLNIDIACRWLICGLLVLATPQIAFGAPDASVSFDSVCDFSRVDLVLKSEELDEDIALLHVSLNASAVKRLGRMARERLGLTLTVVIDGKTISTAKVMAVMDVQDLQIAIPRREVSTLMESLLISLDSGRSCLPQQGGEWE